MVATCAGHRSRVAPTALCGAAPIFAAGTLIYTANILPVMAIGAHVSGGASSGEMAVMESFHPRFGPKNK